jgi:glycine betaine transporter
MRYLLLKRLFGRVWNKLVENLKEHIIRSKVILKNPVFSISASVVLLLVILGVTIPGKFGDFAQYLFILTTVNFGWFYMLAVFSIIIFLIGLTFTKYGGIRIGGDDERPEFSFFSWVAMLFSAGFGVGLVFWGVAEPMSHFFTSPVPGVVAKTEQAARIAMGYAFFHWGISQWSVFAIVGLIMGFLQYRKKKDGLVSTALEPVTGSNPVVKNAIDSFSVIATVMGIATSLGLGILQINGGLDAVFKTGISFYIQLVIILIIFFAYMLSATTGLDKGIRYLSNLNLVIALILMLFVFVAGPTVFILETFVLALGDYFTNFIQYSLRLQPYLNGTWVQEWTIFYWAWAIAWSPFVGAFVARVSKGRTIREFIVGVMLIPPAIACLWIAIFGGTALWNDLNLQTSIAEAVNVDLTSALFRTYRHLPLTTLLSGLSIFLIFTFLVTSADSATYILASMTTQGSLVPPVFAKLVWGFLMAAISGALLYAGGLEALQTASLISALPFTVILLMLVISLAKLLKKEPVPIRPAELRRFERLLKAIKKKEKD